MTFKEIQFFLNLFTEFREFDDNNGLFLNVFTEFAEYLSL